MKMFIVALALLTATMAQGFQGYNGTQDLGLFNKIKCGSGIDCDKVGDKLVVGSGMQKQVASSATTLTSSQCGSTIVMSGHTVTLPVISASLYGCEYTFISKTGSNAVDADATNVIMALTNALGDQITNSTSGNSVTLQAISASGWNPISVYGTWADGN